MVYCFFPLPPLYGCCFLLVVIICFVVRFVYDVIDVYNLLCRVLDILIRIHCWF